MLHWYPSYSQRYYKRYRYEYGMVSISTIRYSSTSWYSTVLISLIRWKPYRINLAASKYRQRATASILQQRIYSTRIAFVTAPSAVISTTTAADTKRIRDSTNCFRSYCSTDQSANRSTSSSSSTNQIRENISTNTRGALYTKTRYKDALVRRRDSTSDGACNQSSSIDAAGKYTVL